ncbi:MAG: paraquat-inducible protein A [Gammaproteobacteria bacterium]
MQNFSNKVVFLLLIAIAAMLLTLGLVAPIITFKKFFFIQNTFSILTACWNLVHQGQIFLFLIIATFSVVMPIFKLSMLTYLVLSSANIGHKAKKILNLMHRFGRWSMLDVFIVAILVVVVKLGAIGDVEKHIGLYAYAGAAILIMLLTNKIVNRVEQQNH